MHKLFNTLGITIFLILALFSFTFSDESITITTYYPSPYGSYNELYVASKLGIGTTNPSNLLTVAASTLPIVELKTTSGSSASPYILFNSSAYSGAGAMRLQLQDDSVSGGPFLGVYDQTGTAWRMVVQRNGNVGIGTTGPQYKLHIAGGIGVEGNGHYRKALTPTYWGYANSYRALMIGSPSTTYNVQDGAVTISFNYDPSINTDSSFTGAGNEIIFRNGTQFVTPNANNTGWNLTNLVLKDGKLGIGTTSPAYQLDVSGSNNTTIRVVSLTGNGGQLILESNSKSWAAYVQGNHLRLDAGGENKVTFKADGAVGIGTNDPTVGYKLDVEGKIQATAFDAGDITFRDQETQKILWRMFEDENGLYLENVKTAKVYRFVLQEVEK